MRLLSTLLGRWRGFIVSHSVTVTTTARRHPTTNWDGIAITTAARRTFGTQWAAAIAQRLGCFFGGAKWCPCFCFRVAL
jgi:hypothetical protein